MDPKYLLIENFGCHRRSEIDCTKFNSILIIGKGKDNERESNGIGKTTIYYAIDFALFGEYPADTMDEMIRDGCDECSVTFDFAVLGKDYRIIRSRRKKKSTLVFLYKRVGDEWHDISEKTSTETKAELAKIIKIGYKAFRNSILFAQLDLDGLASNNVGDRLNTLKEALGLMIYKKFEKEAKDRIHDIKKEISDQTEIVEHYGNPAVDVKEFETKLKDVKKDIKNKNSLRNKKEKQIREKEISLSDLNKLTSSGDALKDIAKTEAKIFEINNKIKRLKSDGVDKQKDLDSTAKNITNNKRKLKIIQEKYGSLKNSLSKLRCEKEIEEDLKKTTENEINGKAFVHSLKTKLEEFNTPLPEGDNCPHCRQKMTKKHKDECKKRIQEEIKKLNDEIALSTRRLSAVTNKKCRITNERDEVKDLKQEIEAVMSSESSHKASIENDEKYKKQINSLLDEIHENISAQTIELNAAEDKIKTLKKSTDYFSKDDINNKITKLTKEIDALREDSENLLKDISSQNTIVGILSEKISTRKDDIKSLKEDQKELDELKKKHEALVIASKSFGPKGIPSMVIHTILDDLQIETNKFLTSFRPGLELRFVILKDKSKKKKDNDEQEDTLDIKFFINGKERSYKLVSGGQKFIFAISLKLGLSMVIQKKLGVDIKFIELDEVDQSLDLDLLDTFVDVVKKIQENFKVFIITHNEYIKSKFTQAILVEGDPENGSTSKLVSIWN
jgi:DNA repair exonuclease SbcCD ATPase subunit